MNARVAENSRMAYRQGFRNYVLRIDCWLMFEPVGLQVAQTLCNLSHFLS